jgi:hypothetical protein
LKTEINGRGDPLRWPRDTLYPQKLAHFLDNRLKLKHYMDVSSF